MVVCYDSEWSQLTQSEEQKVRSGDHKVTFLILRGKEKWVQCRKKCLACGVIDEQLMAKVHNLSEPLTESTGSAHFFLNNPLTAKRSRQKSKKLTP